MDKSYNIIIMVIFVLATVLYEYCIVGPYYNPKTQELNFFQYIAGEYDEYTSYALQLYIYIRVGT